MKAQTAAVQSVTMCSSAGTCLLLIQDQCEQIGSVAQLYGQSSLVQNVTLPVWVGHPLDGQMAPLK